ncbi:hypothetical protein [Paenibacillus arenosi]|uniref:DUF3679 domain-containing protein n=1 Tax=Paenibacillus arenosi TaxID=2774142 RepID=A0ABR9AZP5_9BACL|nr:hypothetical protein [Paenibacillus arenosi]MBD8499622.1 hypothetical protein [Paenibacillus arenosi]
MQKMRHEALRSRTERFLSRLKTVTLLVVLLVALSNQFGTYRAYATEKHLVQTTSNMKHDNKGSIDIASKEIDSERKQQLLEEYGLESEQPSNNFQGGDFGFSVSDNPNQDTLVMYLLKLLLSFIKSL